MFKTTYTMVIPGLMPSREHVDDPALSHWLAASKEERAPESYYAVLMQLFGYPEALYNFAKLRAVYDGLDATAHWICADPVHLGVDVAHVYSLGNAYLDLSQQDVSAYVDMLNSQLQGRFELHAPHPLRWYIKLDRRWEADCRFLDEILAKTIVDKLPQGPDALPATLLFNELQMLLHNASLNVQRRQQAQPTVDALWLWGLGRDIPRLQSAHWDCVQTNDVLALALARLNRIKTAALSEYVQGNVLFVDTQYQFKDSSEQRFQQVSDHLKKLYVGNGLAYVKRSAQGCFSFLRTLRNFVNLS